MKATDAMRPARRSYQEAAKARYNKANDRLLKLLTNPQTPEWQADLAIEAMSGKHIAAARQMREFAELLEDFSKASLALADAEAHGSIDI